LYVEHFVHFIIGVVDPQRTAVGTAIATAVGRLKKSEAKSKVIVLLTDGQSNAGEVDPPTAARAAAAFGIKIYTVGAGAPGGGLIEVDDPFFGKRLVRTPENELDEATLRRVAEDTHGAYFRATDLASLKKIYGEIDRMEKTDVKTQTFAEYRDVYRPWLWLAFLLFVAEGVLSQTLWRRYP
jgi:Ca-activated chloride channel family protein